MEKSPSSSENRNDAPVVQTPCGRLPLSPRCPGSFDNAANQAKPYSPAHHETRPQSVPWSSSADVVIFDPLQNNFGFPVVHCAVLGKKHTATYAPTPAHRNALGYLIQIKNEGNTHRDAGSESFLAMQKMELDEKRRTEMTTAIVRKGVANLYETGGKPAGIVQNSQMGGIPTDNIDCLRVSCRDIRKIPEARTEVNPRRSRGGATSRICRNSHVPGSSSFISEAVTNMMSKADTETQCSYPFREQFETLWTASHMGRSIAPEALSSKRSRGCLQSNDSVP